MLKLNFLLPILLLLSNFQEGNQANNNKSCDLQGNWSQVNFLIDIKGGSQALTFTKEDFTETFFLEAAQKVHHIYFSGQGNIDLDQSPTLSLSKKKLSYKGTKLGRYQLSDDCKTIKLQQQKIQDSPDTFASCTVLFRHENIIAMEQGKEVVFYLKRDPQNPFFVGNE